MSISLATAGAFLGSHLGEIGSALGGVASLGSMFGLGSSGGTSLYDSKALMEHQRIMNQKYTQWLNENQYSQLRTGLEKAGYNPLLALGASPAQGSVGQANATSGTHQDLGALLSAMSTLAQIKLTEAQTKKINTNTVDKILDNIDSVSDKFGLPKAVPLIKDLVDNVVDISQNSSNSFNNPTLYGKIGKFGFSGTGDKIKMIQNLGMNIGRRGAEKLIDYWKFGSSKSGASDFQKLSMPNKLRYMLWNAGIYY